MARTPKAVEFDVSALQIAISSVQNANNGKTWIDPSGCPLNFDLHSALGGLLTAYGFPWDERKSLADDRDLIALWAVTIKNPTAGYSVASKLASKLGIARASTPGAFDPFASMPAPAPFASMPDPTPAPAPAPAPSKVDVREEIKQQLGQVIPAIQSAIDEYARETKTSLALVQASIEARVATAVDAALKDLAPVTLTVTSPKGSTAQLGLTHRKTPEIIRALGAGVNVYLYGPAGSGKTTIGQQCAKAFDLPFYFAAKVESEYLLLGFKDANGQTVRTQFRDAYENGGVFLFDEFDGSSAGAVVALNAALANGYCPFPDGTIARHPDFYCIAAGNTGLTGASRQYVGRQQLDAASVDRFAFIALPYDEALERNLASNPAWCDYVQRVRKAVEDRGLNHLVTPRATYDGCKLLEAGFTFDDVADMCIFKALDPDTVKSIKSAVGVL